MRTFYAKNLAGDILPLSFPSSPLRLRDEEVCQAICPEDPSSVRIVSRRHSVQKEVEEVGMGDGDLSNLMEELHAMACEDGEEEENGEKEEDHWVWEDGDQLGYLLEADALTVHLSPPMGGPYYAVSDPEDRMPLYPITVWIEREVETGVEKEKEKRVVSTWTFLFSLRTGLYRAPSDYAMEVEGGGGDVYLALRHAGEWHASVFDAIRADEGIPARYKERMLRAMYRKWVRVLRNMGRRSPAEREIHAMYATEWVRDEKRLLREHYRTLRTAQRVPHR